jgi:hypothetical protein
LKSSPFSRLQLAQTLRRTDKDNMYHSGSVIFKEGFRIPKGLLKFKTSKKIGASESSSGVFLLREKEVLTTPKIFKSCR